MKRARKEQHFLNVLATRSDMSSIVLPLGIHRENREPFVGRSSPKERG